MKKYFLITNKSFEEEGVTNHKELWDKVKAEGYEGFEASVVTTFTKAEDKKNRFHAIFSTSNVDRHGDIVQQEWDLKSFKKNPVFLDSHRYDSIEHILGKVIGIKSKDQLEGDIEFMLDNPKGMLAYKMAQDGFLNATSVGFIPLDFGEKGDITKSELLEVSAVSVPANAQALFEKVIKEAINQDSPTEENEEEEENEEMAKNKDINHSPTLPEESKVSEIKENRETRGVGDSILSKWAKESEEEQKRLKRIADALEKTTPLTVEEKKRKIWKDLRVLISKDNG